MEANVGAAKHAVRKAGKHMLAGVLLRMVKAHGLIRRNVHALAYFYRLIAPVPYFAAVVARMGAAGGAYVSRVA